MELVQFKGIVPLGNTAVKHRGNRPVLLFSRKVYDFTRVILGTNFLDLIRFLSKNRKGFHRDRMFQTMKKVKREDIDTLTELNRIHFELTEPDLSSFGTENVYL